MPLILRFGPGQEKQFQNGIALSTDYRRHTCDSVSALIPKNNLDFYSVSFRAENYKEYH